MKYIKEVIRLYFTDNIFSRGDNIDSGYSKCMYTPWYLRILGISIWWNLQIIGEPEFIDNNVVYTAKYVKTNIKWFKWYII